MAGYIGGGSSVTLANVQSNSIETSDIQDGAVTAADLASTLDLSSKTITGIPVTNEFAQYVRNYGASVDGANLTSGAWNTVALNSEISDTIGASIGTAAAYAITLPAGTYFVIGACQTYRSDRAGARLRDTADTTTLMTGGASHASSASNTGGMAFVSGQMTLASSTSFYFQVYANAAGVLGLRPSNGEAWQQSYLNIWKIA